MRRIVYTRTDGGVNVCCPAPEIIRLMSTGGRWLYPRGTIEEAIERQCKAFGVSEDVAARFVKACAFGGLTEAEAYGLIRDRDCAGGLGAELWDASDLPPDRWFRDAWRRSQNGGPIRIDLGLARAIQWQHIRQAIKDEQQLRESDLSAAELVVDLAPIKTAIKRCDDIGHLKRIWPKEVPNGFGRTGTTARNDASPINRR